MMEKKSSTGSVENSHTPNKFKAVKEEKTRDSHKTHKPVLEKNNDSCLVILKEDGAPKLFPLKTSSKDRPCSSDSPGRKAPPVNRSSSASSSRTVTPTKYVALQAVRRKQDGEFSSSDIDICDKVLFEPSAKCLAPLPSTSDRPNRPSEQTKSRTRPVSDRTTTSSTSGTTASVSRQHKVDVSSHGDRRTPTDDVDDDDDDDDDESSSDSEPIKAPNELLMEFLDCVMKSDWTNAQKLCKMILIYEPTNPEALNFQPLIDEKIALGASANDEDEDEDEDDDDSDSSSESDESDTSESSDDGAVTDSKDNKSGTALK